MNISLKDFYQEYLIHCLNKQCKKTKLHIDKYKQFFANNRHSAGFSESLKEATFAMAIHKAVDARVFDLDGNAYLDLTMGFGVHFFGHSPLFIKDAILQQLNESAALGPLYINAAETAELICTMTKNDRCAFFNSGTEAVMVALRLARAATGKYKIVIFEGCYHGTHDSLLAMKQHPVTQEAVTSVPGISQSLVQDTILLKFGEKASLDFIEQHGSQIAAVLTEPVRSRHPEEINPLFLHQLQNTCSQNNIAFILDEVITGFRLANGGAKEYFSLDADIVTYGKIAGGGMPVGIVAGKKKYLDFIDGGEWHFQDDSKPYSQTTFVAGTFCHHPLSMAAAKATLLFLKKNNNTLQTELNNSTTDFCNSINTFCEENDIPVRLANFGSMFRFFLKGKSRLIYYALLKEKIYIWEGRTCFLSIAHQHKEMEQIEASVKKCLVEMKAAEYFPSLLVQTERKLGDWSLESTIEIEGTVDKTMLRFSFNYVCENIRMTTLQSLSSAIHFAEDSDNDKEFAADTHTSLYLHVHYSAGNTILHLKAARSMIDGWSMILILRHIGKCIQCIENAQALLFPLFAEAKKMQQWLVNNLDIDKFPLHTSYETHTLEKCISFSDINKSSAHTLFEVLLAKFALAFDEKNVKIGVPVSGQLTARILNAIGNYSCIIPVALMIDDYVTENELAAMAGKQLNEGRKNFRYWYAQRGPDFFTAVFNFDNLLHDFKFGDKKIISVRAKDEVGTHPLVCNVIAEENGLHISIKFTDKIPAYKAQELLDRFCLTIIGVRANEYAVSR
jgi:glutamate-1-semialdehyde aminotransferase